MTGAYGRIDWMVQLKTWKIIGYTKGKGKSIKEIKIGRATEREVALAILNDWYKDNKMFVRYA